MLATLSLLPEWFAVQSCPLERDLVSVMVYRHETTPWAKE